MYLSGTFHTRCTQFVLQYVVVSELVIQALYLMTVLKDKQQHVYSLCLETNIIHGPIVLRKPLKPVSGSESSLWCQTHRHSAEVGAVLTQQ